VRSSLTVIRLHAREGWIFIGLARLVTMAAMGEERVSAFRERGLRLGVCRKWLRRTGRVDRNGWPCASTALAGLAAPSGAASL
jgi:hypothetical protein